jgi:hypothetical protein
MDTLTQLGTTLGIGTLAGARLYTAILAVGLGIRFQWIELGPGMQGLEVLAHPAVLGVAGVLFAIEFLADKIPWVDSAWDAIHTVIRPIGAAILGATALGHIDAKVAFIAALLCGTAGLASHGTKATTRLIVNHSPEPFTNIATSLAEDGIVVAGVWFAFNHPLITMGLVAVFVVAAAIVVPMLWRVARRNISAGVAFLKRRFGFTPDPGSVRL